MPLVTLPNLYATPQDVMEMVGIDAVQLREDDQNQASGQAVELTAGAAAGAAALTVAALQYPLLGGTVLIFRDAGLEAPVSTTLTATAAAAATNLAVSPLATALPSGARAIDNGVNVWLAGMALKACRYATARIKSFCCNRYNDSDLAQSWSVNQWATVLAARWMAVRRFNAAPQAIEEQKKEVEADLKAVRYGHMNVEDIGTRTAGWPFMSNVTIDDRYTYRKLRVEQVISEPTPTQYPQAVDWSSIYLLEW